MQGELGLAPSSLPEGSRFARGGRLREGTIRRLFEKGAGADGCQRGEGQGKADDGRGEALKGARAVGGGGLPQEEVGDSSSVAVRACSTIGASRLAGYRGHSLRRRLEPLQAHGGGIVAFYAGCQMGGVTVAITFALSFVLTWLVGRICFREGLPNNVVSRYYIFGKKGSAAGSLIWIFVLVGVLAVGTVQLGNATCSPSGGRGSGHAGRCLSAYPACGCSWSCSAPRLSPAGIAVFVVALLCVMG